MCRLADRVHFRTFGFVVLRSFFDPAPLARELDECLHDAASPSLAPEVGVAQVRFQYAPMMEHLFHASSGGALRTQWRVDYVAQPVSADGEAQGAGEARTRVKAYYAAIFPADGEGECSYDAERNPSYGADWTRSGRKSARVLGELGVYDMAARHETRARPR